MSEETTTIEITKQQRERLRELGPGSAKASLATLLDVYDRSGDGE